MVFADGPFLIHTLSNIPRSRVRVRVSVCRGSTKCALSPNNP